jgi:hypothetical protein
VALHRGIDGSEPLRPDPSGHTPAAHEERRVAPTRTLAAGTLACPRCDAPVAAPGPPAPALSPASALACPLCGHAARVRDFLSLATPTRPAHVEVRVVERGRVTIRPSRDRP